MIVKWNIDNGYINPMPDQIIEIDNDDLEDMTKDEKEAFINNIIKEEFFNNISYYRIS